MTQWNNSRWLDANGRKTGRKGDEERLLSIESDAIATLSEAVKRLSCLSLFLRRHKQISGRHLVADVSGIRRRGRCIVARQSGSRT